MLGTAEVYVPTTKDYLDVMFRRRWPYLVGVLTGVLLILFMQSRQLATYQSEALIFVQERSKSTTFVQGLSRTTHFHERWLKIQNLIFNKNTIKHHTEMFAGIIPYSPSHPDSLEEDYLNDKNRYTVTRRVPYSLYKDRYVSLTPYQWWMIREILDELGWIPPVSEGSTERQVKNRVGVAHWFWVNIFNPMEKGLGWPIEDNRLIKGPVRATEDGREIDARLGEIVDIEDRSTITAVDRDYAQKISVDGKFNEASLSTHFLANTTLTLRDLEMMQTKGFVSDVESGVNRGLIPDGFKVSFTWNNPRVTRFVVAWVTEMVFRFNEYYQHKEIFESQDLLENQQEVALENLSKIQNKVSKFLIENVEKYETAIDEYVSSIRNPLADQKQSSFPTVVQYQPPENTVRKAYNRTVNELGESQLRLAQAEAEILAIKRQLGEESPEIKSSTVITNPDYSRFQTELLELQNERQRELYTKTPRHPHVVELTRQIDALKVTLSRLEKNVLSESSVDVNPLYRELKEKRSALETEIIGKKRSIEELKERRALLFEELKRVPEIEQRIQKYKSELNEARSAVGLIQERINQVKTEEQFTFALAKVEYTIKILPTRPDTPEDKIWIHVGMAIVLTLFISGIIIFFCEFLDVTIKEINDINRYLDVNVIGVIPKIPTDVMTAEKRRLGYRQEPGRKPKSRIKFMKLFGKKS